MAKKEFLLKMPTKNDEVGIVRGLAWTSVGGDTLQIEVNVMPGKGKSPYDRPDGDVMKESAQDRLPSCVPSVRIIK